LRILANNDRMVAFPPQQMGIDTPGIRSHAVLKESRGKIVARSMGLQVFLVLGSRQCTVVRQQKTGTEKNS
jgi:hypothetical protein